MLLTLDGEQVTAATVELRYRHRGLEKLAEGGWAIAADLAPRLDPLAPLAGAVAYATALEELAGVPAPRRAAYLRPAALELERAASHLGWLARLARLLGIEPAARLAARLHFRVGRVGALLAGPAGSGFIVPGGVAGDAPAGFEAILAREVEPLRRGLASLGVQLGGGRLVGRRPDGLGTLDGERAGALGASGPVLRASGVADDGRTAGLGPADAAAYVEVGYEPIARRSGDSLARYAVRMAELGQAINLAERAVAGLPDGPVREPVPEHPPAGLSSGRVEGPRGTVGATVVADDGEGPRRVAFRGPSLAHAMLLPELLVGCRYADVPVLVASLDLSMDEAER